MATALRDPKPRVYYPESDGKPMADSTLQFDWIVTLKGGANTQFFHDPNVFVAGDLLWYPVEGNNKISLAPDAMIVFGRPKGHRRSYLQWEEDNIPPQVVFEVLSHSNTASEMTKKRRAYERYGVEEYYEFDPEHGTLSGWIQRQDGFQPISNMEGWISPRLGVQFRLEGDELVVTRPDGRRYLPYEEVALGKEQDEGKIEMLYSEVDWNRQMRTEAEAEAQAERQAREREHERAERAEATALAERQAREQAEAMMLTERQERERANAEIERLRALLQQREQA